MQSRKDLTPCGEGILYDPNNSTLVIGFQRNGNIQTGEFGTTGSGKFGQISGKNYGILPNGQYYEADVIDGKVVKLIALVNDITLKIDTDNLVDGIRFDTEGQPYQVKITLDDKISLQIANGVLDKINFVTNAVDTSVNTAKDLAQKYSNLLDQAYLKEPHTDIIYKGNMVAADMKLDWIGDMDTMLMDAKAAAIFFWIPANIRWAKAVTDAVPKIVDLMKDTSNRFIFTAGVNSGIKSIEHPEYRSLDEMELLKNSFDLSGKRIMFAHSAGTEAQLKAILKAKQDGQDLSQFKFVFASPRVSRDMFVKYLNDAGVTSDQVHVITAAGDYPHYPTDIFGLSPADIGGKIIPSSLYDYENSGGRYSYAFLERDLTYEADPEHITKQLGHGGMIDGALSDHEYQVVYNGVRIPRVRLKTLYGNF